MVSVVNRVFHPRSGLANGSESGYCAFLEQHVYMRLLYQVVATTNSIQRDCVILFLTGNEVSYVFVMNWLTLRNVCVKTYHGYVPFVLIIPSFPL